MTNEKRLLERAGLRGIDTVVSALRAEPDALADAVAATERIVAGALRPVRSSPS